VAKKQKLDRDKAKRIVTTIREGEHYLRLSRRILDAANTIGGKS
jgi:hypothetical protein